MRTILLIGAILASLMLLMTIISAGASAPPVGDEDNDGVLDTNDLCPGTAEGQTINSDGCSVNQICSPEMNWKNHGQYVSCVTHLSKEFLLQGLIAQDDRKTLITEAAQSDIGKK